MDKDHNAIVSGMNLGTALERDSKGFVQIRHKHVWEICDHYKEFERNIFRQKKSGNESEAPNFLDLIEIEAIKFLMYTEVMGDLKYAEPKEIWELRITPPTAGLLDRNAVDPLLENIWKLAFEVSSHLSLEKDTMETRWN